MSAFPLDSIYISDYKACIENSSKRITIAFCYVSSVEISAIWALSLFDCVYLLVLNVFQLFISQGI